MYSKEYNGAESRSAGSLRRGWGVGGWGRIEERAKGKRVAERVRERERESTLVVERELEGGECTIIP